MSVLELTASQAVKSMQEGTMKVSEYIEALLDQIKEKKDLNAFISIDEDLLRKQAKKLDDQKSSGGHCGPLFGLPIAVKDNIETSEYATSGGTGALKTYIASDNAPFLQTLLDQGAIVLGKTNLHELAFGITSNNGVFGPIHNPYNPEMISGGSSGGSAVAVAARMSPFAIGTDTGGSTRIPPALCGIVGYRPTMERYGSKGAIPISQTRDTFGTMARTVEDIQLIDQIFITDNNIEPLTNLSGIRLGLSRDYYFSNLDTEVEKATNEAIEILKNLGAEIIEIDIENLEELNNAISLPICLFEAIPEMEEYLDEIGLDLDQLIQRMGSPDVKGLYESIRAEPPITREAYERLLEVDRPKLQNVLRAYFQQNKLDAIIFPTTKVTARPIGQDENITVNGIDCPTFPTYIHNTDPSSIAGFPGISVPMGLSSDGLPMGLEFDGPENSDSQLLKIARVFQEKIGSLPAPK